MKKPALTRCHQSFRLLRRGGWISARAQVWQQRIEFLFRDGINVTKTEARLVRAAKENDCFRKFMSGPRDDAEYERVLWDRASRRVERVRNENGAVVGEAVVYEAPMEEAG